MVGKSSRKDQNANVSVFRAFSSLFAKKKATGVATTGTAAHRSRSSTTPRAGTTAVTKPQREGKRRNATTATALARKTSATGTTLVEPSRKSNRIGTRKKRNVRSVYDDDDDPEDDENSEGTIPSARRAKIHKTHPSSVRHNSRSSSTTTTTSRSSSTRGVRLVINTKTKKTKKLIREGYIECTYCGKVFHKGGFSNHERACRARLMKRNKTKTTKMTTARTSSSPASAASSEDIDEEENTNASDSSMSEPHEQEDVEDEDPVPEDHKRCPLCNKVFHNKGISRHLVWCQEQQQQEHAAAAAQSEEENDDNDIDAAEMLSEIEIDDEDEDDEGSENEDDEESENEDDENEDDDTDGDEDDTEEEEEQDEHAVSDDDDDDDEEVEQERVEEVSTRRGGKCRYCPKEFTSLRSLAAHQSYCKRLTAGQYSKLLPCPYCPKQFRGSRSLSAHVTWCKKQHVAQEYADADDDDNDDDEDDIDDIDDEDDEESIESDASEVGTTTNLEQCIPCSDEDATMFATKQTTNDLEEEEGSSEYSSRRNTEDDDEIELDGDHEQIGHHEDDATDMNNESKRSTRELVDGGTVSMMDGNATAAMHVSSPSETEMRNIDLDSVPTVSSVRIETPNGDSETVVAVAGDVAEGIAAVANDESQHSAPMISSKVYDPKKINTNDVLLGRGGNVHHNPGNIWFRKLVKCNQTLYASSPKHTKLLVARSIIHAVQERQPVGGRFMINSAKTLTMGNTNNSDDTNTNINYDTEHHNWKCIGYEQAVAKASQALRDAAMPRVVDKSTKLPSKEAVSIAERASIDPSNNLSELTALLVRTVHLSLDSEGGSKKVDKSVMSVKDSKLTPTTDAPRSPQESQIVQSMKSQTLSQGLSPLPLPSQPTVHKALAKINTSPSKKECALTDIFPAARVEFLSYMGMKSADEFMKTPYTGMAVLYVKWRVQKGLPRLKDGQRGALSILSKWKSDIKIKKLSTKSIKSNTGSVNAKSTITASNMRVINKPSPKQQPNLKENKNVASVGNPPGLHNNILPSNVKRHNLRDRKRTKKKQYDDPSDSTKYNDPSDTTIVYDSLMQKGLNKTKKKEAKDVPLRKKHDIKAAFMGDRRAKRRSRCGKCKACTRDECGKCKSCLDKPKFGGKNISRQVCIKRRCPCPIITFKKVKATKKQHILEATTSALVPAPIASRHVSNSITVLQGVTKKLRAPPPSINSQLILPDGALYYHRALYGPKMTSPNENMMRGLPNSAGCTQRKPVKFKYTNGSAFPHKVYDVIEHATWNGYGDVISWSEQGCAFIIHDHKRLSSELLNLHFPNHKDTHVPFVRRLIDWNFIKISDPSIKYNSFGGLSFTHPFFQRGRIDNLAKVTRGNGGNKRQSLTKEENEYDSDSSGESLVF